LDPPRTVSDSSCISLETYRKTGAAVRTTVWLVEDGGLIYIRTAPTSGKVKRMRRNPRVRVAPCDFWGKLKGEWVDAEVRRVTEEESKKAKGLFLKKYGLQIRLLGVLARLTGRTRDEMLYLGIMLGVPRPGSTTKSLLEAPA